MHITSLEGLWQLENCPNEFLALFEHGSQNFEKYKPEIQDKQTPHERDEIYVIISGKGTVLNNDKKVNCKAGDFVFVPAGIEHRFTNFIFLNKLCTCCR